MPATQNSVPISGTQNAATTSQGPLSNGPLSQGPPSNAPPSQGGPPSNAPPSQGGPPSNAPPLQAGPPSNAPPSQGGPPSNAPLSQGGPSSNAPAGEPTTNNLPTDLSADFPELVHNNSSDNVSTSILSAAAFIGLACNLRIEKDDQLFVCSLLKHWTIRTYWPTSVRSKLGMTCSLAAYRPTRTTIYSTC